MTAPSRSRPALIAGAMVAVALASAGLFAYLSLDGIEQQTSPETVDPRLPAETADADALQRLGDWLGLPVFDDGVYLQQSSTERKDLPGAEPTLMLSSGNRDMNNFLCVGSRSEQTGKPGVSVVTELDSCPEDYVRGFVLSRFEGSGRLARLWMTSTSLFRLHHRDEVLRVYVDDDRQPLIEIPFLDAVSGRAGEIFQPPFGAGRKFFLAWYYPVVFASRLIITLDRIKLFESYYHQTDVVLDRVRRPRVRAASRLEARDRAITALEGQSFPRAAEHGGAVELLPGGTEQVLDLAGPGTIRQVVVRGATLDALRPVQLQARWDDGPEPAIDLPLLALFSSQLAPPLTPGPVLSTRKTREGFELTLRLPMPFRARAGWRLHNAGAEAVELELLARVEDAVPGGEWGHLHAQYFETTGPTEFTHHPLARARGRGRLVGVCATMEGHGLQARHPNANPLNFLEGDEWGLVDGKPALPGTGTEDYFNGSFYFAEGLFATAFAQGQASVLRDRGIAVCCRWHVLGDAIDFQSSLDLSLEIGPGQPSLLERYRTISFLYL